MAANRGFDWSAGVIGALARLAVLIVIGLIIVFGGLFPVGASTPHSAPVNAILGAAVDNGVKHGARGLVAPKFSEADIREGGSHFKGMCEVCHGGPGVKPGEFAGAMLPTPPNLSQNAGDWSDSQIFWIAKNGIKMSAMPAFGKTDTDDELWKVAAFVKSLPKVSPSDYAALPNAHEPGAGKSADQGPK